MKTYNRTIILYITVCVNLFLPGIVESQVIHEQHTWLEKVWETPSDLRTPESVIYDSLRDILYVSNYNILGGFTSGGDSTANEFISRVNLNGEIEELKWVDSLISPCGMAIYNDTLYVVERKKLAVIDIENGELIRRYSIPGSVFPNDIAFDSNGIAYITDNDDDAVTSIYEFNNGVFSSWLSSDVVSKPNGIFISEGKIIVGDVSDISLKAIDINTKQIDTLALLQSSSGFTTFDGVQSIPNNRFLTSFWHGPGFIIDSSGTITEIVNTSESLGTNVNNADFTYIKEYNLLIIPTFMDNRLIAYEFTDDSWYYLGQPEPGNDPVIFLPGVISAETKNSHALSFSPDRKMLIFSRYPDGTSYIMSYDNNAWSLPEESFFTGKEISFSSDGNRIYYYQNGDIFYVEKNDSSWNTPVELGSEINTNEVEYYPSLTENGTMYFSRDANWSSGRIMRSGYINGEFQTAVDLGEPVNGQGALHAFVSPDESYMLFNSPKTGSYTDLDIWVSFRNEDNTWTEPQNMGEKINSGADAVLCPTVTPDGKFLFFTRLDFDSNTGNVYWVSTEIIDSIRNNMISDVRELTPDYHVSIANIRQISPNPFNVSVLVEYVLFASSFVNISIYNTEGKLVKILTNSNQYAGDHSVI